MQVSEFLQQLAKRMDTISFRETMDMVDECYDYTPTAFSNGALSNPAGANQGSCKIFAFAALHQLSVEQTLACFGDYYREDVLKNPGGSDHANIRHFMEAGWSGVKFAGQPLRAKECQSKT